MSTSQGHHWKLLEAPPVKQFDPCPPTLETSEYAVFRGENSLIILSAQAEGVTLSSKFSTQSQHVYLYSERVWLQAEPIRVAGLHLTICCRELLIVKDKAIIDVSGAVGDSWSAQNPHGGAGGAAGSLSLYIQKPDPQLASKLVLQACGGNGGEGQSHHAGTDVGGNGGDGGPAGSVNFHLHFPPDDYKNSIKASIGKSAVEWVPGLQAVAATLEQDCKTLKEWKVQTSIVESWGTLVRAYTGFACKLTDLMSALRIVVSDDPGHVQPTRPTLEDAKTLKTSLEELARVIPNVPSDSELSSFSDLSKLCQAFAGGHDAERKLRAQIGALTFLVEELKGDLHGDKEVHLIERKAELISAIEDRRESLEENIAATVCRTRGGHGGPGGRGATTEIQPGKRGSDGANGKKRVLFPNLGNERDVRRLGLPPAFPEQCQMVLDRADSFYFTNKIQDCVTAGMMYNDLTSRLVFLERLRTVDGGWISDHPTVQAYSILEYRKLTMTPLDCLHTIYETAQTRQKKILLGQDLFCHDRAWAPRLSFTFYEERVEKLLNDLGFVESVFEKYAKAEQKAQILANNVERVQKVNEANLHAARDHLQHIMKSGGELHVTGSIIAQSTPRLRAKRQSLISTLRDLKNSINESFHVSTESIVEAMATWAMAPHAFFGGMQGLQVAYKSWTGVDNIEGHKVNKEFVIDQLETCQDSIASLTDTYRRLRSGGLTVDNPAYGKILVTVDLVRKILNDFKKIIPEKKRESVQKELDDFVALILKRNNAVVAYNAQIQWCMHLLTTIKSLQREKGVLGDKALSVNSQLPAIYFWLKRTKTSMQLDILQRLNYEARALAFWGPLRIQDMTFSPPGPMDGTTRLREHQRDLAKRFEECYETLGGGLWSHWPASKELKHQGLVIDISDIKEDLIKLDTDSENEPIHQATFSIGLDSIKAFTQMANVRLSQVRVWCLDATTSVNSQGQAPLTIHITHLGYERIWNDQGEVFEFKHAPVLLEFRYDTLMFNNIKKCSGDPQMVLARQYIEKDYGVGSGKPAANDYPPLGPFTDWKLVIRPNAHEGLDMSKVSKIWLELCGRHQPAQKKLS